MKSGNSSSSPGESPQLGTPWDALLKNPLPSELVPTTQKSLRENQTIASTQSNSFSWKRLSFRKFSFTDRDGISPLLRCRQSRFGSRQERKRVVSKHGDVRVIQGNVAKRRRRYLKDIFTTLVDLQWRWTMVVFCLNFLLSWLGFALVWWMIALMHGDLKPENNPVLAKYYNVTEYNKEWVPCVTGINGFTSSFLYSVETQHTIGYGGRMTTEKCADAIVTLCSQSIVGVMIQAFMVGIVFVKLSRPIKRTHTLLFSRNAVICQREGQMCLMFRVGDMRKSHIIEAHVRAQLIRRRITREGELLPFHQEELKVGSDGEEDRLFFIWPMTVVHKITPESPLYRLSAADLVRKRFEIVVLLEGIIESTGMTTQARSSYLPDEILWGHRFRPMTTFGRETGEHEVDYSLFNDTYEVNTPLCSAAALDELIPAPRPPPVQSEPTTSANHRLSRTSSEIIDVSSIDSRVFPDNSTNLMHSTVIIHSSDPGADDLDDTFLEQQSPLRDNHFRHPPPRSPFRPASPLEPTALNFHDGGDHNGAERHPFADTVIIIPDDDQDPPVFGPESSL